MRRRITFAILGTVAAALIFAGLGTLALNRVGARNTAERDIRSQAEATGTILHLKTTGNAKQRILQLRNALNLKDVELVVLNQSNQARTDLGDPIPANVHLTPADFEALRNGEVISGSRPAMVWSAVPTNAGPSDARLIGVLFLTRGTTPTIGSGVGWFILASIATLLLGALIAARLSRRIIKPLNEATAATARIAHGDLTVRVPESSAGATDELDGLARSINGMADSLERSRGLERQFLLSVSHDLRTPLTSIRGYAEAIADGATPDAPQAANVILAESRRLERLVGDLLDLAKLEGRQFSLQLAPIDLGQLMADSVDGFRREVEASGLRIALRRGDAPQQAIWALADADRLAQVVANLVENAIKYARASIEVAVVDDPSGPRIEVTDDGPGIAAEDLPHVFERLYVSGHQPARKEVGSGLGLAIVRELTEAMGGRVRAEAGPTGGTRMVVTLRPAASAVPPQPRAAAATSATPAAAPTPAVVPAPPSAPPPVPPPYVPPGAAPGVREPG
jgi:two-component system sensor histidine kinase BaeS